MQTIKPANDLSNLVYGRLQPQALDLEQAVLGGIMLDKDALTVVLDILRPESFYKEAHQSIYEEILVLFERSQPIDLLTVSERLRKVGKLDEIGGVAALIDLTNKVGSAANIEYHARIVAQKYIQRALISVSTNIINDAFEDKKDVFEMLDAAEQGLYDITDKNLRSGYQKLGDLALLAQKQLEVISENTEGLSGTPSGFSELDKLTNGFQKSDLIILAARPGMGKTSFCLALVRNAAVDYQKPVAFFSLEMSNLQLAQRLISMEAEIEGSKMRNAQLEDYEWQQLNSTIEKLSDAPIFIDDTPALNIFELRAKSRRLKQNHDIQLIVIDYLQLMTANANDKRSNREQEISSISRALKGLAKELNIPVIALAQLSRAVETRGGEKIPQLSDLRESGAIEQDADIVSFLYRPDYYGMENDGERQKGETDLIIAKHRNGALKTIQIQFIPQYAKFQDLSVDDQFIRPASFNEPGDY